MKRSAFATGAASLALVAAVLLLAKSRSGGRASTRQEEGSIASATHGTGGPRPLRPGRGAAAINADWHALLAAAGGEFSADPEALCARLAAMRVKWLRNEPVLVAQTIGALLRSGQDRPTGLRFEVGPDGFLSAWPSLRVFLIDVLAGADPETSASIGRSLLRTTASGDEYAVALRLIVREGAGGTTEAELLSCLGAMLARDAWRESRGVAEAFDLARAMGSARAARLIADFDKNPALQGMALHEFGAEHPAALLEAIGEPPPRLDPLERASLLARADASDPAQVSALEAFLHDPRTTPGEVSAFLSRFPLRSATTGYRLFGNPRPPFTREEVRRGDQAALQVAEAWLEDPDLQHHRREIEDLRARLQEWLQPE